MIHTDKLPKHRAGLTIGHNEHKGSYLTAEQAVEENEVTHLYEWVSKDEKQKAVEKDSIWILQWYPKTPIGFFCMAASNLEVLIDHVYGLLDENGFLKP